MKSVIYIPYDDKTRQARLALRDALMQQGWHYEGASVVRNIIPPEDNHLINIWVLSREKQAG